MSLPRSTDALTDTICRYTPDTVAVMPGMLAELIIAAACWALLVTGTSVNVTAVLVGMPIAARTEPVMLSVVPFVVSVVACLVITKRPSEVCPAFTARGNRPDALISPATMAEVIGWSVGASSVAGLYDPVRNPRSELALAALIISCSCALPWTSYTSLILASDTKVADSSSRPAALLIRSTASDIVR